MKLGVQKYGMTNYFSDSNVWETRQPAQWRWILTLSNQDMYRYVISLLNRRTFGKMEVNGTEPTQKSVFHSRWHKDIIEPSPRLSVLSLGKAGPMASTAGCSETAGCFGVVGMTWPASLLEHSTCQSENAWWLVVIFPFVGVLLKIRHHTPEASRPVSNCYFPIEISGFATIFGPPHSCP